MPDAALRPRNNNVRNVKLITNNLPAARATISARTLNVGFQ